MKQQPKEQYKPVEKLELKELTTDLPKAYKVIDCPSCEKEVTADNLNLQNKLGKCGSCNAIFSIANDIKGIEKDSEVKQEILRPEGIDLFFFKDDLDITVQDHIQGLDAFGIVILPMLAIFSIAVFFLGKKDISPYIPIVLSTISLYFIYRGITYSKNKTYIDVNDRFLNIRSRPKNFRKDRSYEAADIDQLYLKYAADGSGYYTIFIIVNDLNGQKHEKLLTVNTLSKAKYLEQEIERYLNIEDRKVPEANV